MGRAVVYSAFYRISVLPPDWLGKLEHELPGPDSNRTDKLGAHRQVDNRLIQLWDLIGIRLKYSFAFLTSPPFCSNSFRLSSNVSSVLNVTLRWAGGVWISSLVAWQNKQQWRPGWNVKRYVCYDINYYCFTINCLSIFFLSIKFLPLAPVMPYTLHKNL